MKDNASRQRILRTCRLSMIGMLWLLACAAVWKTWNRLPTSSPPLPTSGSGVIIDPQSAPAKPAQLPEFSLVNCDGRHIHRSDVLGHPVVLSFIFTKCTSTCPDITRQMRALHERLSDTDTLVVTITVDPKRDTAKILKRYAESNAADLNRWLFLTGEPEAIYELINDGLGLAAQELFGEQRQPGLEIAHTNRVVLVSRDGQIQATYLATNPDDIARLQIQLKQLARPADSEPPPEESSPAGLGEDADAGCGASTQADPLETAQTPEEPQPALLPDWPLQGIADFQLQECNGRTITRDNLL
ncbi:MAG: SCO family protein, partial [Planctomycetaceae bacterium]